MTHPAAEQIDISPDTVEFLAKRLDTVEGIGNAVDMLRALRSALTASEKLIRSIAENPDCGSATCGLDCKEYLAKGETK